MLFASVDCPVRLSDVGIGEDKFEEVFQTMLLNEVSGRHHQLTPADYRKLLELMK
jgi:hypothetical protein